MRKWLLVLALVAVPYVPVGEAAFLNGNRLLKRCDGIGSFNKGFCWGYIAGVADTLTDEPVASFRYCVPSGIVVNEITDVVITWLEAHPAKRHHTAHSLVALALSEAFPCKN